MFKIINRIVKKLLRWKSFHRIFAWPEYAKWVDDVKNNKIFFVPFTERPYVRDERDPKIFAYYLPQFYAIPENDMAHGKGFTEWQNVASCAPHFVGQYQPKIPYDLGFYNLLMPGVMERQVEIARSYGIYGFCFYYYWFSGRKVLEKPLEYWLQHKEIDFHYHFCWANENWSKKWDGGDNDVFLRQEIKEDDAKKFFLDILPYIQDERYEKIGNKPILMIYRLDIYSKDMFLKFITDLNLLARKYGFDGFYTTSSNFFFSDPLEWGLNGITEFPPHEMWKKCKEVFTKNRLIPGADLKIFDTHEFINEKKYLVDYRCPTFRCCFPSWDNSPRRAWNNAFSFLLNDSDFQSWFNGICVWTQQNRGTDEQYVYINAWNEWGEGAVLEPTVRFGYKYLQIIKDVLETLRNKQ